MAFCQGKMGGVKDFLNKLTPELEAMVAKITTYTGEIKALEANPTAQVILGIIPQGSEAEALLNTGLDVIQGAANVAKSFAEKLSEWLNAKTQLEVNASLAKLASVSAAQADAKKQSESFYDTLVQVHVAGLK